MPDAPVADILRAMNQNGGNPPPETPVETPPTPAAEPVNQTPPAQAAPVVQPVATQQPPVTQANPTEANKEFQVKDPEWAVRNKPAAQPDQPVETPAAAVATPPAAQGTPPADDTVFFHRVSEMTRGTIKSESDFVSFINQHNSLVDQVKQGVQPKFPNERAEWAYKTLLANPGTELDAAIRTATALKISEKLPTMSAKDKLFNGFVLDPMNSDLSPENMKEVFDAHYEKKYGDPETRDILTKREHDIAVRQAEEAIQKISSEFKVTQAEPERISQEVVTSVNSAVQNFGGVKLSFSDNPSESLTIPIENEQELAQIKEDILDPGKWHERYLSQFEEPNGKFNYEGYLQDRWERENHVAIRQQSFEQGKKMGRLEALNEARNSTKPADIADKGRAPVAATVSPKNLFEAMLQADQGRK